MPRQAKGRAHAVDSESQRSLEALAAEVVRRRRELGLSQRALAKLVDKPQPTISQLENAQGNPTLRTIHAVALALGARAEVALAPAGRRRAGKGGGR